MVAVELSPGELIAAGTVFPVLGILATALRIYSRHLQNASLGLDDWLIIAACPLVTALGVILLWAVAEHAYGYPAPAFQAPADPYDFWVPHPVFVARLTWYLTGIISVVALGLIKLSLVALYRRIFAVKKGRFNIASIVVGVIVLTWTLSFFAALLALCHTRPSAFWASNRAQNKFCGSGKAVIQYPALLYSDVITDIIVILLPLPMVYKLQMRLPRKIAIAFAFALGSLSIVFSIIRASFTGSLVGGNLHTATGAAGNLPPVDVDRIPANGCYWTLLEAGVAILAASTPVCRIAVLRFAHRLNLVVSSSSNHQKPEEGQFEMMK